MNKILFSDSGGTGTDWGYIDDHNNKVFFKSESYHPINWGDEFWMRLQKFWNENQYFLEFSLKFYGAGCLNAENAQFLKEKFQSFGFKNVQVQSDLHAAGLACVQNNEGSIIIAGTGSVLFNFSNGVVTKIIGGKGHEIGDEGSGFYFGRLVIEKFKNDKLSSIQVELLKSKTDIDSLSQLESSKSKFEWASLSKILKDYPSEFIDLHEENIRLFIATHFVNEIPNSVSLVGSYAFYHQELWIQSLSLIHCKVDQVILSPIEYFVE